LTGSGERWERVKELFHGALDRQEGERAGYLAAACGDDRELRAEVERMLRAHGDAGEFLAVPAAPRPPLGGFAQDREASPPERIGPYRVLRELGRGGMGRVYLAEQESGGFQRRVAIKVLVHTAAGDLFARRFGAEQQILAGLEHTGIARLYDGGVTAEGVPYFAMEYVEGENVLAYAAARRSTIAERVRLFRRICAAVHYAHQHLVVHRDLKPSNILVTAEGEPRLLDFGIAKLLHPQSADAGIDATVTSLRLLTPEYASPEQVRGEAVTTATDVYSLGVVLYELLTGCRPYRLKTRTAQEVERAVCEQEPRRPSAVVGDETRSANDAPLSGAAPREARAPADGQPRRLRRLLRGDLDTIVLKALDKDPRRRYATAAELDDDLRRYLEGRPVQARPESVRYRATKFVRRHRLGVAAMLAAVLSLVVGLAAALWQANVARAAQARAERRFHDVRSLANTLLFDAHDAVETLPGSTSARNLLLERGLRYLDGLAAEARGDPALQIELAAAYLRLGDLQGRLYRASLGDSAAALASYEKGLALAEASAARGGEEVGEPSTTPASISTRSTLARLHTAAGRVLFRRGRSGVAAVHLRLGLALAEKAFAVAPADLAARHDLVSARLANADIDLDGRRLNEAVSRLESARVLVEETGRLAPGDRRTLFLHAVAHQRLTVALSYSGRDPEALVAAQAYLALARRLVESDANDAEAQRNLALAHDMIAWRLLDAGEYAACLAARRDSLRVYEALAARDPSNGQAQQDLAVALRELGRGLLASGRPDEALPLFRRGRELCEALSARDAGDLRLRGVLAGFRLLSGRALLAQKEAEQALAELARSIEISEALIAVDPEAFTEDRRDVAEGWYHIGEAHDLLVERVAGAPAGSEHREQARAAYSRSRAGFEALAAEGKLGGADLPWLERARARTASAALAATGKAPG